MQRILVVVNPAAIAVLRIWGAVRHSLPAMIHRRLLIFYHEH